MKRVIVTGAAGFLGSHLAKHHLDAGDKVLGVDNFCSSLGTYERPSAHFKDLLSYENFKFRRTDIAWHGFVDELYEANDREDVDIIYNFACPASPPRYQEMPVETMMTCVAGTRNVLRFAKLRPKAVVVHASTSEVYGDPEHSPQQETYRGRVNSYGPRACYDEGKRAAEALCFDYFYKHKVDARLVRIFNTYGPNMDPEDGRVVSNFICQALRGEKLTIYGGGTQTRSFCYVDDLISGIVAMGDYPTNPLMPINLGNPNEFTIYELAQHVIRNINTYRIKDAKDLDISEYVTDKKLPVDDPLQRRPDITKARDLLGWEPKVQLEEGLDKTIEYFRKVVNT